jgi:GPH family glycoside/pentoside/hexuronide:cation symporter
VKETAQKMFAATRFERTSYDMFFAGQNIIFLLLTSFLSIYYTSTLGIPATIVAVILLTARIWDAFVDPLLATFIEKSNLKAGKFKPWVMLAAYTVPVLTVLCFSFSDMLIDQSLSVRVVYATLTYFIWGTLYAASDAPAYALSTVMTPHPEERNLLLTFNKITGLIGGLGGLIAFPLVLSATNDNWFISVLIFSVIAFLTMFMIRFTKERVKHVGSHHPKISEIFKSVANNKYLVLIVIISLLSNGTNFAMTLTPFIGGDIFGDPSSVSIIMAIGFLPMIFVAPFAPMLIRKFGKINLTVFSFAANVVFSLLIYFFTKDNFTLFLVLMFLRGLLSSPFTVIYSLFFSDTIEYDAYQNGTRFEAVTFAAQTFMAKISTAISGGLGMWIIGVAGYKAAVAGETVTQTPTALNALWATMNLGPVVGSILAIVILLKFYDLTEDKVKMMIEVNLQKANTK